MATATSRGKLGKNSSTVPFREEHTDMNILIDALAPQADSHVYQVRMISVCCQVHRKAQSITATFTDNIRLNVSS